jgi:hypothetical protein
MASKFGRKWDEGLVGYFMILQERRKFSAHGKDPNLEQE